MSRVVGFPMMHYTNPILDDHAAAMTLSHSSGDRRLAPYIALSRLARALTGDEERASLFLSLPHELRKIIRADVVTLELHNGKTGTADMHVLFPRGSALAFVPADGKAPPSDWQVKQRPLIIPDIDNPSLPVHDARLVEIVDAFRTEGVRSLCVLPLATPRRPVGVLFAGSRDPHAHAALNIEFLSLIADQVATALAHAQHVEKLRRAVLIQRERAQSLEASDELLRALSGVLDIREVFPRISQIAAKVLAHDRLTMTFHAENGDVVIEASSSDAWPAGTRLKCPNPTRMQGDTFTVVDDFENESLEGVIPADFRERIRADGFRSMICVGVKAGEQQMALIFWSTRPATFTPDDLPVARRIADHVALAVSHQQLSDAAQQVAEARGRAERLEARVKSLAEELEARAGYARVVGDSPAWKAVLKAATQVSATDTTVLLAGESGTGKEVVARFIHRASNRSAGPFVAINCAALPEQLLESELFGYERGAFTGAQQAKPGQIELASGGVLFLDEVSEMSPSAQAKFLRVLQEREFQRLGGTRTLKANVRVIAATNRDLKKAVERKEFREDLYYRLQVFDIAIPPLRERASDILPLSEAFLAEIGQMFGRPPAGLTRDAKDALLGHRWPGNVRELRNALERAVILCEGSLITPEHLSLPADAPSPPAAEGPPQTSDLHAIERDMIARVLRECNGNKSKAAKQLGLSRTQLYGRMRRYNVG